MGKKRQRKGAQKHGLGVKILEALHRILNRCKKKDKRLHYPGEGTERPFRAWLADDLLKDVLGWPTGNVVIGEIFDIRLDDDDGYPVITTETKSVGHKPTSKDKRDFEERLPNLPSLRFAYFTNGEEWERLKLIAPRGIQEIEARDSLTIDRATPEEIEAFFQPLRADRYLRPTGERSKIAVSRNNPPILQSLAFDFDGTVRDLSDFFYTTLMDYLNGNLGKRVHDITRNIFDMWCGKSLVPEPTKTLQDLRDFLLKDYRTPNDIATWLSDMGFSGNNLSAVADRIAGIPILQGLSLEKLRDSILPLYETARTKLCAQTAHVILARAVLYRVGEDTRVFQRKISAAPLEDALASNSRRIGEDPCPAISLLLNLQKAMHGFLPNIYQRGEFDWWLIEQNERASMDNAESALCASCESQFDKILQRTFRMLDTYFFGEVDVDVWRNVYQNYLPPEERQRLGGFYTPDELVHLILDLTGYVPEAAGLCQKTFVDPACGSGAFIAAAAMRLLEHLKADMPCHAKKPYGRRITWKESEKILTRVQECIHAIDIHPFAAFLTTVNLAFLLLPEYIKVHEKNPDFPLDLRIFSADALEKPEMQSPDLFLSVNSRIQLSRDSLKRYAEFVDDKFDFVVGNPPWGGILKGPLAPVFNEAQKKRFKGEFPAAAQGKYDIYGLFMERALQILKNGGKCGFVTQGTFIDKKWAKGLRKMLTDRVTLEAIVDLNPFGHLFFHAMNTPAVIRFTNAPPKDNAIVLCILSSRPGNFKGLSETEKRAKVDTAIRKVLTELRKGKQQARIGFASGALLPLNDLEQTALKRWNLSRKRAVVIPEGGLAISDLLEHHQGITPGGQGCLSIFLMPDTVAMQLGLESSLVHRVCKGRETIPWSWEWTGKVILYPYELTTGKPAFSLPRRRDALNFDEPLDDKERELMRGRKLDLQLLTRLLQHREALKLVRHPKTAKYLLQHYETLEQRRFEKKNIRDYGKQWYEYHRPRNPRIMTGSPKIITARLAKRVRSFLDTEGIVPQDSCVCLVPKEKDRDEYAKFEEKLSNLLGAAPTSLNVLKYCLAFLNSPISQRALTVGRRPTPKGSYAVTEDYLQEVPVVLPRSRKEAKTIMRAIENVLSAAENNLPRLEKILFDKIENLAKQ